MAYLTFSIFTWHKFRTENQSRVSSSWNGFPGPVRDAAGERIAHVNIVSTLCFDLH
jgi:hypothetical protein